VIDAPYSELQTKIESIVYVIDYDESQRDSLCNLLGEIAVKTECFSTWNQFLNFSRPNIPSCLVLEANQVEDCGIGFHEHEALDGCRHRGAGPSM
jgi:FixJ family two-component response regulator